MVKQKVTNQVSHSTSHQRSLQIIKTASTKEGNNPDVTKLQTTTEGISRICPQCGIKLMILSA